MGQQAPQAALVAAAREAGWKIREGRHGFVLYPLDGSRPIAVHANHNNGAGRKDHKMVTALVRRAGLDV